MPSTRIFAVNTHARIGPIASFADTAPLRVAINPLFRGGFRRVRDGSWWGDEKKERTPLRGVLRAERSNENSLLLPASDLNAAPVRRSHDFSEAAKRRYECLSRGWWVQGVLARLQVLLGGTVVCHIRFSTMANTMMVVYIGV